MKREDVKTHIPGITDEALNWLMNENGADINREKAKADTIQQQLTAANKQLQTVQEQLKAFDGKDVGALEAQVAKLTQDIKDQADGFALLARLPCPFEKCCFCMCIETSAAPGDGMQLQL